MQVFKIAGNASLEEKYKGSGYAIGAVLDGQLVAYSYLRDALPDLDWDGDDDYAVVQSAMSDSRLGSTVRMMQSLGAVVVGMCSSYEFVVL